MISTKLSELFTVSVDNQEEDWLKVISNQHCKFLRRKCIKVRKSQPEISIGTCTVKYGKEDNDIIICPHRLIENRKIFLDCIHLLTLHEPGNDLHVVSEVGIPGGSIDYVLLSTKDNKVVDFVGVELQTLDTTGTVWPVRQRFLKSQGFEVNNTDFESAKTFGMNWKMTAKTILVQLHHKIETFETLNRHLVLVVQDKLLDYMQKEFSFGHISKIARIGDSMHFHSYRLNKKDNAYHLSLFERMSTDSLGISKCMGLQAEANIELEVIIKTLQSKISASTILTI
ncbi:Restriction endonuclease NotI [Mucilaginibacter mallensis]|uniref:Restriction endonuclease NotI n=1 Tax=Mucilaginibacter mallensis TaxID=652787 RepID=A0A1H2BU38_MUCMA|nr:NotI family restriction endonuclease [Mucilaginibacter mallensis]SDT61683.1 Restriction endonuclease NotI [Mucilaginibacter mallensis]